MAKDRDSQTDNKLYNIKPHIGSTYFSNKLSRRDEQTIHRLRIGHTHLTHAFILKQEKKPICSTCNNPLTVEHFLLKCNKYRELRNRHFKASSLKELVDNINNIHHILNFVKDAGIYKSI